MCAIRWELGGLKRMAGKTNNGTDCFPLATGRFGSGTDLEGDRLLSAYCVEKGIFECIVPMELKMSPIKPIG